MLKRFSMVSLLAVLALAQQVEPKVPPPRQPQEPTAVQGSLEVLVLFNGQAAEGIPVSLWELGPGGRLLLPKQPNIVRSNTAGKVRWEGLGGESWVVRLQGKDGFSLTLPVIEEYLALPSQVGPYQITLHINKP